MSELIVHHFDTSPFSEKVRLILGFKQLTWRSVEVPKILPKPDVVALTGGYRRTPFLQIGADIYCDTALMCRVIDRVAPEPPLYPASAPLQHLVAQWADSALFWSAIPYALQPAGAPYVLRGETPDSLKAFAADRAAMTAGMRRQTPVDAQSQLTTYFTWLTTQLGDHRFLFGEAPCIADFSVAHSIWFIHRAPPLTALLSAFAKLASWYERVMAFGNGRPEPLASSDAIAIAARAGSHAPTKVEAGLGFEAGTPVTVAPTDYAADPVPGTLIGLSHDEVVIERRDERAGTVHVHFPRIAFQIKKAA